MGSFPLKSGRINVVKDRSLDKFWAGVWTNFADMNINFIYQKFHPSEHATGIQAMENKELSTFKLTQMVLAEVYMKKHVLRMGIVEYTREQRSTLEKNGRYLKTLEYTPEDMNKVHQRK